MKLTRREFGAGALGIASTLAGVAEGASTLPNILYIMLDDLGLYDTGCYGSTAIHTPNIDRLAAEGMQFGEAYSGCTVCAPARSTLFTGLHMGHTPVRGNSGGISLPAGTYLMSDMLRKGGYVCGGFGKWGIADLDTPGVPEKHGFDRFFGYYHQLHAHEYYPEHLIDTGRKVPLPGNQGFYAGRSKAAAPGSLPSSEAGAYPAEDSKTGLKRQFSAYVIFDEMKKFLRENKNKPFFCYAPWSIPHGMLELPDNDPAWTMYKDKPWHIDARVYAAYCTMADRFVGETMAVLKETGQESNTLVCFCSDNGAAATYPGELNSAGHLRGKKTTMYEGGIRVPFIARFPGKIKPGSKSDLPFYFPDMMPTIAEFTGTTKYLPSKLDGISIAGEMTGKARLDRERPMYWEWNEGHFATPYHVKMQACRRGQWKIVRNDVKQPWELYDLSRDPGESNNLAAAHLVKELDSWVRANRADPPPQVEPVMPAGRKWR